MQLLTVAEVGQILRLSDSKVYSMCSKKQLICYKIGRSVRVDGASVEAILKKTVKCRKTKKGTAERGPLKFFGKYA